MSNFNEAFRLVQVNRISVIDFNERCAIHNPQVTEAWIQIDVTILVFFVLVLVALSHSHTYNRSS